MGRDRRPLRAPAWGPFAAGLLLVVHPASAGQSGVNAPLIDVVAVGIVNQGDAIVLATPGLPHRGRLWRFRSLDTSDIPHPIRNVALARSGTKLLIQPAAGPAGVLDLTRQTRNHAPLQYVSRTDLSLTGSVRAAHRLPAQRFISFQDGAAYVIDDAGGVQSEYPPVEAAHAAIADDGVVLYVHADGSMATCSEDSPDGGGCRTLPARIDGVSAVHARAFTMPGGSPAPRFVVVAGDTGSGEVRLVDPEGSTLPEATVLRTEAALRACLLLHRQAASDSTISSMISALVRESAETWAADGQPITEWRFFRVEADIDLYAPILEFARLETVFPSRFDMLEKLREGMKLRAGQREEELLYDRYLRLGLEARRDGCSYYVRERSMPGSWAIEFWLYYPFDVGGLGSHPHDPEHFFVEVDKLGGTPRRVIGAGHGYVAGNNVFTADNSITHLATLPLYAIVELGKHAVAPDVDRDGVFTPGVDENEYEERAKIWGVRDVIGTINNQLLPYDSTMSGPRQPQYALAPAATPMRFPSAPDFGARAACHLLPMDEPRPSPKRALFRLSDWIILPPCHELTTDCAKRHVTEHPDFLDPATILKEWSFPHSFLRATYGFGPGRAVHSIGLGYAGDLDRLPGFGRILPLPGRIGFEAFYWKRTSEKPGEELADDDGACPVNCRRRESAGWGLRYEQFLSNLFGIFSAARYYVAPFHGAWFTFGPLMEAPLGKHSNINLLGGVTFGIDDAPQFELRISVGIWKPKTNQVGMRAETDHRR